MRRANSISSLVMAIGIAGHSVGVYGEDPPSIDPATAVAAIEKALATPVTLEFHETPLADVAAYIQQTYGIPVGIDVPALRYSGVSVDELKVTGRIAGVSLQSALNCYLRELEITFVIRDETLEFTSLDEADHYSVLKARVYDVADLLSGGTENDSAVTRELLCDELIHAVIAIESRTWNHAGGIADVEVLWPGYLVVMQSRPIHVQIADLLAHLRVARHRQGLAAPGEQAPPEPAAPPGAVQIERIETALKTPVGLDFHETPLTAVAANLADRFQIPVAIDGSALSGAGYDVNAAVMFRADGVSLRAALTRLLGTLELAWDVKDEMLLVTTFDQAENWRETRVYPVLDIVPNNGDPAQDEPIADYEQFINVLTSSIAVESWTFGGGEAECCPVRAAGAIAVSQTRAEHRKVAEYLAQLRQANSSRISLVEDQPPRFADDVLHVRGYAILPHDFRGPIYLNGSAIFQIADTRPSDSIEEPCPPKTKAQEAAPAIVQVQPATDRMEGPRRVAGLFAETIPHLIAPDAWEGAGGEGAIRAVDNVIFVRQVNEIHRQVARLLKRDPRIADLIPDLDLEIHVID